MRRELTLLAASSIALAGCFSQPRPPELFVSTVPSGASCTVNRQGQPIAVVEETPGIAILDPTQKEFEVQCRRHAFNDAVATVAAYPVGERFDYIVAGRPLYEFPGTVTLVMTPRPLLPSR
jgi:hypothetical protein